VQIDCSILLRRSYANIGGYVALTKPRVMLLVVFTAFVGLMVAPGGIDPLAGAVAVLCIAAGAGAAGALNMWYDADIDAVMARTAMRPIPSGRVSRLEALVFGLMLGMFAIVALGTLLNIAAAALLAFTIFFYVVVYTMWLKRRTPQNIVIGGAAGALPPVIGWVAVAGYVELEPLILFLIIFLWTPPHFWALSLNLVGEYARAGVPMLPVVAGRAETKRRILLYSVLLVGVSLMPWVLGFAGAVYALSGPSFWCAADECCTPRPLILIGRNGRVLLWTITTFTLAHSITLSPATLATPPSARKMTRQRASLSHAGRPLNLPLLAAKSFGKRFDSQ